MDNDVGKLALKEIRLVLGETYPAILTIGEASMISRFAVKTLYKKVSEGEFKHSVKRGNPIEMIFSKIKQLLRSMACRTREALWNAMQTVLDQVSATDAANRFNHCGYTLHLD